MYDFEDEKVAKHAGVAALAVPNRKVVKASILYNMIGGYFILLFVFDSSWFRSLGE